MNVEPGVPGPPREPLLPRWLKVLLWLVGLFLFVVVGDWVLLDVITRQDLRAAQEQIRSLGWPLYPEDLYPDPIPPEENAALLYQQAFAALSPDDAETLADAKSWSEMTPEEQEAIRGILRSNADYFSLLHQAAQLEKCQFDLDYRQGFALTLSHLAGMRSAARALRTASEMSLVEGDLEGAFGCWLDSVAVVRHLRGEKTLISALVRLVCLSLSVEALESLLQSGRLTEEQLNQAASSLEGLDLRGDLVEGLKGELVFGQRFLSMVPRELRAAFAGSPAGGAADYEYFLSVYCSSLIRPWRQYDHATYLRRLTQLIQLTQQPYYQAREKLNQWEALFQASGLQRLKAPASEMLLPGLGRTSQTCAESEALLCCARTATALERYRLRRGRYPDSLTDLTPEFLPAVPLDPFTGKLLLYVNKAGRVALGTVGASLEDARLSKEGIYRTDAGVVFTLRPGEPEAPSGP